MRSVRGRARGVRTHGKTTSARGGWVQKGRAGRPPRARTRGSDRTSPPRDANARTPRKTTSRDRDRDGWRSERERTRVDQRRRSRRSTHRQLSISDRPVRRARHERNAQAASVSTSVAHERRATTLGIRILLPASRFAVHRSSPNRTNVHISSGARRPAPRSLAATTTAIDDDGSIGARPPDVRRSARQRPRRPRPLRATAARLESP